MLRVIDRQTITEEELLLKLGVILEIENLDAGARSSYAEHYAKRSSGNRILFMTIMPLPRASISYESCLNGYCTVSIKLDLKTT